MSFDNYMKKIVGIFIVICIIYLNIHIYLENTNVQNSLSIEYNKYSIPILVPPNNYILSQTITTNHFVFTNKSNNNQSFHFGFEYLDKDL